MRQSISPPGEGPSHHPSDPVLAAGDQFGPRSLTCVTASLVRQYVIMIAAACGNVNTDENGVPTPETLKELGLEEYAGALAAKA